MALIRSSGFFRNRFSYMAGNIGVFSLTDLLGNFARSLVFPYVSLYILALGGTRWEAARQPIRNATRTAMTPIINSMMVVGVVSLPGMMTGQLLSGVPPMQAVKYQIVIMFLIASATSIGAVGVVLMAYRRLFSPRHQFRAERMRTLR